jgi:hypothetical protein
MIMGLSSGENGGQEGASMNPEHLVFGTISFSIAVGLIVLLVRIKAYVVDDSTRR